REGREEPLVGPEPAGARRGDESRRPSAGRRRRQDLGRPAAHQPLGQGRGEEDPTQEEAVDETDCSGTEERQGDAMIADWRLRIADWTCGLRIRNPQSEIRNENGD